VMVAVGVLLGLAGIFRGSDSAFLWIDVGICLMAGVLLFLIGLIDCRAGLGREAATVQIARTFIALAAVVAVLAPALDGLVELVRFGPSGTLERECEWTPREPPADTHPS
jgi:uncharacterized membrane protein